MNLDVCTFVPVFQPPFKQGNISLAPPEDRLAMVRLATQQHSKFKVSDVEIQRGGISYTIDTIRHFASEYPGSNISFLIGSDQAVEFVRWKNWEDILKEAQLCVVRRPFLLTPEMEERITERLTDSGKIPVWISAPLLEISSTDIRNRSREGKSINYLTVKAVRDYISDRKLYG